MRLNTAMLLASFVTFSSMSFAKSFGTEGGNGGDICENRIKTIRDDINSWILNGGSIGLKLPSTISLLNYNEKMRMAIAQAEISCTDDALEVHGVEKTCKNIYSSSGRPKISCNSARFSGTSESDQYVLIHHEIAGLAGFEVNSGSNSDYTISNQITGFLEDQWIKKLSIKPNAISGLYRQMLEKFNNSEAATLDDIPTFNERSSLVCTIVTARNSYFSGAEIFQVAKNVPAAGPNIPAQKIKKVFIGYVGPVGRGIEEQEILSNFIDFKIESDGMHIHVRKTPLVANTPLDYVVRKSDFIYFTVKDQHTVSVGYCYPTSKQRERTASETFK